MFYDIILLGISTLFWRNLFLNLNEIYKPNNPLKLKLLKNKYSKIHAIGCVVINSITLIIEPLKILSFFWSYGYFMYDFFIIFNKKKLNFLSRIYLMHHIFALIAIYYMSVVNFKIILRKIILLAELSNIPHYFVYEEIINNRFNSIICKRSKLIQVIIYPFIRVIILGYYANRYYYNTPYFLKIGIFFIYSIGTIWSYKLVKQYLKN